MVPCMLHVEKTRHIYEIEKHAYPPSVKTYYIGLTVESLLISKINSSHVCIIFSNYFGVLNANQATPIQFGAPLAEV